MHSSATTCQIIMLTCQIFYVDLSLIVTCQLLRSLCVLFRKKLSELGTPYLVYNVLMPLIVICLSTFYLIIRHNCWHIDLTSRYYKEKSTCQIIISTFQIKISTFQIIMPTFVRSLICLIDLSDIWFFWLSVWHKVDKIRVED